MHVSLDSVTTRDSISGTDTFRCSPPLPPARLTRYFFTFGFSQRFEGCYYVIVAASPEAARERMNERFASQWAMQYDSAEAAGVERFGLREVK